MTANVADVTGGSIVLRLEETSGRRGSVLLDEKVVLCFFKKNNRKGLVYATSCV